MKTIVGINLYDLKEVAGMIGVSVVTVRRYVNAGTIRAQKIGGGYYVSEEAVREFVTGRKNASEGETVV